MTDFNTLFAEGLDPGLVVNARKCEIISDDSSVVEKFSNAVPEIDHVTTSAAMLLGALIATSAV